MSGVKQWLWLDPLDTLFFRGAEPMIAGEDHEVRSVFPPLPETLVGALRTAVLFQRRLKPRDFTRDGGPSPEILEKFPLLGTPDQPGFQVLGPLLWYAGENHASAWFFPAPAHCYGELEGELEHGQEVHMQTAGPLDAEARALGLCGSTPEPLWVKQPMGRELKSLSGYWLNLAALETCQRGVGVLCHLKTLDRDYDPTLPALLSPEALYVFEERVGIALEAAIRRVRRGHLYSATQVRLKPGVSLAVGLDQELAPGQLNSQGLLVLGGEGRQARYSVLEDGPSWPAGESFWVMSLSPFPFSNLEEWNWQSQPRCSGPLVRRGGWDLKKGFHKPMRAYLPAGTVIQIDKKQTLPFGFIRL